MRTFVRIKEILSGHLSLLKRIEEVEKTVTNHDTKLKEVFRTLKEVIGGPLTVKRPIGELKANRSNCLETIEFSLKTVECFENITNRNECLGTTTLNSGRIIFPAHQGVA